MDTQTMVKPDYYAELIEEKFKNVHTSLDRLSDDVKNNTKITREVSKKQDYTNGKVHNLGKRVDALESRPGGKPSYSLPSINDKFLTLMALAAVIIVIIVASNLNVDISKVLP